MLSDAIKINIIGSWRLERGGEIKKKKNINIDVMGFT